VKFQPLTENELQTASLAPEGIYQYQIIKAEDGISKSGNEKIDLKLKIWNDQGVQTSVFSNLSIIKLLKHFCDVNYMEDNYNSGEITASLCQGKSGGRVVIGIASEKPNPYGGVYPAKNIVTDYIKEPKGSLSSPLGIQNNNEFVNDDVPF
jgi:hypothetical protein